jgi:hypothetical protein
MTLYSRAETNAQSLIVLNTTEKNSVDKYDWDDTLIVDGDSTVVGAQGYATAARKTVFIDDVEATLAENRERGLNAPGWWEYMTYTDADGNTRHKAQHLVAFKDAPANTADLDDNVAADVASAITISGQPSAQSTSAPLGAILTVTRAGTAAAGTGSYTITDQTAGVTVANVSGGAAPSGTWSINVSRAAGVYTVTLNSGGTGFAATDTITVPGDLLGGAATTNDLVVTVATVATAAATFSVTASATTGSLVYQWQRQTATGTTWSNISGATSSSLALTGLSTTDNGRKYRVKITTSAGAEEVISSSATLTVTAA